MDINAVRAFIRDKGKIWVPAVMVIFIGIGVLAANLDSGEYVPVNESPETDPVYYPPEKTNVGAVVVKPVENVNTGLVEVEVDSTLLQKARDYRLKSFDKPSDGGAAGTKIVLAEGVSNGGFNAPPAPPSGSYPQGGGQVMKKEESSSLVATMVIMGSQPRAWIDKAGLTQEGSVGDTVFGKRITSVTPTKVCFNDNHCVRVQ